MVWSIKAPAARSVTVGDLWQACAGPAIALRAVVGRPNNASGGESDEGREGAEVLDEMHGIEFEGWEGRRVGGSKMGC